METEIFRIEQKPKRLKPTNSQTCLKLLENMKSRHKSELECYEALNRLASNGNQITMLWAPGHSVTGNEFADEAAEAKTSLMCYGNFSFPSL